ncbi:type IV secretory system conjugative DNA transfer family protein [Rothia sp. P5764]|uniref:type IV secretory system conjugative DNA transfer family protein n=1 Tax=Rothia sp. P5764 TaxID=3402654 RepID=UPI003AD5E8D1
MRIRPSDWLAVFTVALAVFGAGGLHLIFSVAYFFSCGTFGHSLGMYGVIPAALAWGDATVVPGQTCVPGRTLVQVVAVVYLVVLISAFVLIYMIWDRWMQSDKKLIKDLSVRDGIAQAREVNKNVGAKALKAKAHSIRPTLDKPQLSDVGRKIGVSQGLGVWLPAQDTCVVFGPPRSGKGVNFVINEILDSPGAVITTSTRGDNAAATWLMRSRGNRPVIIFDPQSITGVKTKMRWSPYRGCSEPQVARERADVIIGASGLGSSSNNQEWAEMATTILSYLLHAAALGNVPISTFAQWTQSYALAGEAVQILTQSPAAAIGWAESLDAEIKGDARTLQSKWMGVQSATASLLIPSVAELFEVGDGSHALDPEKFIKDRGTLYLIGTKTGGGAVGPLLVAMLDDMYSAAEKLANRSKGSRLDPPMRLVLDEIANFNVWNRLPEVMSSGGGIGIGATLYMQSASQAKDQWGDSAGAKILDSANFTVQLGNSKEVDKLKSFVDWMGETERVKYSYSYSDQGITHSEDKQRVNAVSVFELSRLPMGYSFVMPNTGRPLLMKSEPFFKRKDKEQISASQKTFVDTQRNGQMLPCDAGA